jgi:GTP pyrophosphokinase
VYPQFDYRTPDDLFAGIGTGKVSAKQVANRIEEILEEGSPEQLEAARKEAERQAKREEAIKENKPLMQSYAITQTAKGARRRSNCGVVVKGDADLLVHLAHCCNPVAWRRHRGLCDARPRSVCAPRQLPQRA